MTTLRCQRQCVTLPSRRSMFSSITVGRFMLDSFFTMPSTGHNRTPRKSWIFCAAEVESSTRSYTRTVRSPSSPISTRTLELRCTLQPVVEMYDLFVSWSNAAHTRLSRTCGEALHWKRPNTRDMRILRLTRAPSLRHRRPHSTNSLGDGGGKDLEGRMSMHRRKQRGGCDRESFKATHTWEAH